MAARRPGPGLAAARLDHHDRLLAIHPARDAGEAPGMAEGLEVEQDHVGRRVPLPVEQEVVGRHVGLVAHRHEPGDADVELAGVVEDGDAQGPALARHGDVAPRRVVRREGHVEVHRGVGVQHAHAVGADHPHPGGAHHLEQFRFQLGAFVADLREAGADDDQGLDPLVGALLYHGHHEPGGHHDHRHVHGVGDVEHRLVGLDRTHGRGVGVDRVDHPGEPGAQGVAHNPGADGALFAAGSHDGDAAGVEHRQQRGGHRLLLVLPGRPLGLVGELDGELHGVDPLAHLPAKLEPGAAEDPHHRVVVGEDEGPESGHPVVAGVVGQVAENGTELARDGHPRFGDSARSGSRCARRWPPPRPSRAGMKPRTSGSSRMRSAVAPVSADDRVHRHVAPQLEPDVAADVGAGFGREAGAGERGATASTRAPTAARGSPTISRSPKPWRTRPGCRAAAGEVHDAAEHLRERDRGGDAAVGVDAGQAARRCARAAAAGTTTARRSSPAARWSAARQRRQRARTAASAWPLSATTTRSAGRALAGVVGRRGSVSATAAAGRVRRSRARATRPASRRAPAPRPRARRPPSRAVISPRRHPRPPPRPSSTACSGLV